MPQITTADLCVADHETHAVVSWTNLPCGHIYPLCMDHLSDAIEVRDEEEPDEITCAACQQVSTSYRIRILPIPTELQRVQPSREELARAIQVSAARAGTVVRDSVAEDVAYAILALFATQPTVAEVRAQALRDAADAMDDTDDPDAIHIANGDADFWLRARADREAEGGAR